MSAFEFKVRTTVSL